MRKNNFWVVRLNGEEPELIKSRAEYEKKVHGVSRAIYHGFPTEDEAMKFIAGKWRGKPVSEEAKAWLKEYKAKPGQLQQDTKSGEPQLSSGEYPKYCAYVDGSYDPKKKSYGYGVVFMHDGNIEKLYGGGAEKDLVIMGCGAGELLACMEAVKYAVDLNLPKITIVYDSQLIPWAYHGCGGEMLVQAASQYMYDIREQMEIEVQSIVGRSHKAEKNSDKAPAKERAQILADKRANALADLLAKKGAGILD